MSRVTSIGKAGKLSKTVPLANPSFTKLAGAWHNTLLDKVEDFAHGSKRLSVFMARILHHTQNPPSLMFRLGIIIASFLLMACCTRRETDERLVRIAAEVSTSPTEALATLDSIIPGSLSDADRHFYDFLTVKARDKAYITHESDSLILSVVDYYSTQSNDTVYPEALYYGGRVYSDLGDYPTALDYFGSVTNCMGISE